MRDFMKIIDESFGKPVWNDDDALDQPGASDAPMAPDQPVGGRDRVFRDANDSKPFSYLNRGKEIVLAPPKKGYRASATTIRGKTFADPNVQPEDVYVKQK